MFVPDMTSAMSEPAAGKEPSKPATPDATEEAVFVRKAQKGDLAAYDAILAPTVALSRHIFQTPTYSYKTRVTFLAWLNGYQERFEMLGGQETARSSQHLADLFILADRAGLLRDPGLAVQRMNAFLH